MFPIWDLIMSLSKRNCVSSLQECLGQVPSFCPILAPILIAMVIRLKIDRNIEGSLVISEQRLSETSMGARNMACHEQRTVASCVILIIPDRLIFKLRSL